MSVPEVETKFIELFGPAQEEGALRQAPNSAAWIWPGAFTSTSTKMMWFGWQHPRARFVRFHIEWRPGSANNKVVFVKTDDLVNGQGNIEVLGIIQGIPSISPTASALIVTDAYNYMVDNRTNKHLGWQISGDATVMVVAHVYLEVVEEAAAGLPGPPGPTMTQTQWNAMAKVAVSSLP